MHTDPFLALLESRGELMPEDEDELDSFYDAGKHVTHAQRNSDNDDRPVDNMGGSPFELAQVQ